MMSIFYLPDLYTLRRKCKELYSEAVRSEDWQKACRLSFIQGYLRHDDCLLRRNWHQLAPSNFLPDLGYSREAILAAEERIEEKAKFKGKLQYTDKEGNVYTREAILDPDVEEYYAFEHFGFFKIHKSMGFYSLNWDGEWEFDAEAERRYYDTQYDYGAAKIVKK